MRVLNSISVSSSPSKMFILLRFLVVLATTTFALTGAVEKLQNERQAMMYLSQFGYLSPAVRNRQYGQIISEDTLSKAIMEFQAFVGLNTTGILDEETLELMNTPRCGVKDKVGYATSSRSKRYALAGNLWRVNNLTYKISKYPRTLTKAATDETIRKAFSVWARVTPLTFWRKDSGPADIEIRFERGDHGDGNPFDGPGRTLAHAFYPIYGGDAHFDDSEQWTVNTYRGNNLFQVAVHEFGHSLGLAHSNVPSAVMAPIYRGYEPYFGLDTDDIAAVQALYRHRGRYYYYAALTRTELPKDAELCTDAKIDAIFNSAEGVTYAFKDRHYWKLTEDSIAPGYPKLISRSWPGLPGNIDAAFTYKNGKTYFFKESKYWRYAGKRMDGNYPKEISEGFTGIPDNVDAAMVWGGNGKIYFFKGSKFWKFDPTQKPPVKSSYPKPISNWKGIPDNLDAVLQYTNGWTYFFKDGNYYRFNDAAFQVDNADPPFPRSAGYWWFGCRPATEGSATGNPSNTKEFLFPQLWFSKQGKQN